MFRALAPAVFLLISVPPLVAKEPLDLVPAESMLVWHGRPFPDAKAPNGDRSAFQVLLEMGTRLIGEPLDDKAQLAARVVELYANLITCPHALALIDAEAEPLATNPRARKVTRLQAALIVDVGGKPEPFLRLIQSALNEQTDSARASLQSRQAGRFTYHELRDQRLPDWCGFAWGAIDDYFVLAVGNDVWPKIAALAEKPDGGMTRDAWVHTARSARAKKALIEIIVASRGIRDGLDPFTDGRASDFFREWSADNIERAHWALGFEGRGLFCEADFLRNGKSERHVYADPDDKDGRLLGVVPEQARWAIYRVPPREIVPRVAKSMLATRPRTDEQAVQRGWAEIEARHAFDVQRDLLDNLGDAIVLHNYPIHPLHIPLAMTGLVDIRQKPNDVRRCLDAICGEWKALVEKISRKNGVPPLATIERADDVWYVKVGVIAGPAWTVTDKYIVLSWSPIALQNYIDKMGDRIGRRITAAEK